MTDDKNIFSHTLPNRLKEIRLAIREQIEASITDEAKDTDCSRALPNFATTPAALDVDLTKKLETTDASLFDYVKLVSRWLPANPNRQDIVDKLNAGYDILDAIPE